MTVLSKVHSHFLIFEVFFLSTVTVNIINAPTNESLLYRIYLYVLWLKMYRILCLV